MGKTDLILAALAAGSIVIGSLLGVNKPEEPDPVQMEQQIKALQQEVEVLRLQVEDER